MKVTNHTDLFGRRDFLRIGSLGALGVSLDGVLRANGNKDISCILVWQSGGCGQQDTFDMKPDAPSAETTSRNFDSASALPRPTGGST